MLRDSGDAGRTFESSSSFNLRNCGLLAVVGVRCICRLIFPFSRIFRASGELSRRLPNVGSPVSLDMFGVVPCSFLTSTIVAFFESGMGMREAVFMDLADIGVPFDRLPGLGLEKLAGEGLIVRDCTEAGDIISALVKSVMVVI